MEIVLMDTAADSDLEYEDQEALDIREIMIREQGPGYCHFTLR